MRAPLAGNVAHSTTVLGVDLGGTRMRLATLGPNGAILTRRAIPTPQDDPAALLRLLHEVLDESPEPIAGVVVGVPGVVDLARGVPVNLPNLPRWQGRLSAAELAVALAIPVLMANDADLAALGEHRLGAGQGVSDMLYLTTSTGVGAGVILGGRLVQGRRSLAEIGHTVIERSTGGTVEQLGSGTTLARVAGMPGAEVTKRALAGDRAAAAVLHAVAEAFAEGVSNMVLCFAPERVVIGGGVSQAGDLLLGPVREHLSTSPAAMFLSPGDIVLARGGDDVGLFGAYAYWQDYSAIGATASPESLAAPAGTEVTRD